MLYQKIKVLLDNWKINYEEYDHDPIISYEDAEKWKRILWWEWVESKNVFLTDKKWEYCVFVTVQWQNVNFKKLKSLTGKKWSIASHDEVRDVIYCVPGCVVPFGFDDEILTIVDSGIFGYDQYLFSPGVVNKTIQLDPKELERVFLDLGNKIVL